MSSCEAPRARRYSNKGTAERPSPSKSVEGEGTSNYAASLPTMFLSAAAALSAFWKSASVSP